MINIQGNLPKTVAVACSGGVDSMAVVDFLKRKHKVILLFMDHGTEASEKSYHFLWEYAQKKRLRIIVDYITDEKPNCQSQEEFWRNKRYEFFDNARIGENVPVITCHHLDDCVETWIWSSLNGEGKIIPYRRGNVIRPFRSTEKKTFIRWAKKNDVPWVEDESNTDTKYTRNYIRHEMMPHVLQVNPGIKKVIRKKVENEMIDSDEDEYAR